MASNCWRGPPDFWYGSAPDRTLPSAFNYWREWPTPPQPLPIDPYADEGVDLQGLTSSMQARSRHPASSSRRSRSPTITSSSKPSKRAAHTEAKPEPGYLALVMQRSMPVDHPASSRKLLVLDLNGTLLYRAHRHPPRSKAKPQAGPRLRTVHLRPYMPAFRAYLFAPKTRAWLDTMVWSSAQPHSVEDMVKRVFGESAKELIQVWDRRYLGLTDSEYRKRDILFP